MAKLSAVRAAAAAPADPDPDVDAGDTPPPTPAPAKAAKAVKKAPPRQTSAEKAVVDDDDITVALDDLAGLDDAKEIVNLLVAGESGTGKTTILAFMANLGPILYINAESGIKARPLRNLGVNTANIRLLPDPRKGQQLSFGLLEATYWEIKAQLEEDPDSWAGIAWDSLTEIHKKLLDNIVAQQVSKAEKAGKDRDRFFIDRSDYGVMTEQLRLLIRRYRDLPCHFGMTSLLRRNVDDDGHVVYVPAVTPALQNDVQGFMDIVAITEVAEVGGEDEYRAGFRPVGKFRGKDRFGLLPKKLIDPTFDRIVSYINEEMEIDSDPVMEAAKQRRAALKGAEPEDHSEPDPDADTEPGAE